MAKFTTFYMEVWSTRFKLPSNIFADTFPFPAKLYLTMCIKIYLVDDRFAWQLQANMCCLLVSRPSIFLLSPTVSFSLRASTEQLGRGSWGPGVGAGRLLKYLIFKAWRATDKRINTSSSALGQTLFRQMLICMFL